ncbi:BTAD domain-containing putative transcriptional regulator [Streptomyces sp. NPDC050658]|uniref:AfsR/SARP family transcriptional regulator n=1 Tax=unclassified Streptomyces TaxID=2593676 RepID=UPI0034433898
MELRMLGELAVLECGVPISPPNAPVRQLLALLAASADRAVPTCVLAEELWSEGRPAHCDQVLDSYVNQLRTAIDAALRSAGSERSAEDVLVRVAGGYRLDTGGGSSDARAFERTAGAGYRALEAGDLGAASQRLREALDLWAAAPFLGVAQGPHLRSQAAQLAGSWQRAVGRWIDADIRLGRWRELCVDLTRVLARFRPPTPLYAQLKADLDRKGQDREIITEYLRRSRSTATAVTGRAPARGHMPLRVRAAAAPNVMLRRTVPGNSGAADGRWPGTVLARRPDLMDWSAI